MGNLVDLITRIDEAILDHGFQPVVDFFGRNFGINQIRLARLCWCVLLGHSLGVVVLLLKFSHFNPTICGLLVFFLLFVGSATRTVLRILTHIPINGNPYRVLLWKQRVFCAIVVVAFFTMYGVFSPWFLLTIFIGLNGCTFYLVSCAAPPPKKQSAPKGHFLVDSGVGIG